TDDGTVAPVIRIGDVEPIIPGYDAWDVGPVRLPDGQVATLAGGEVWLVLAAPAVGNPGSRHDRARLRLAARADGRWRDLGDVFAAGASLGGREWAGSAVYRPDRGTVTVFYTAAGRHGEHTPTFGQRIVATTAHAIGAAGAPFLSDWTEHVEVIRADGTAYMRADEEHGEAGFIKAFRDPFFFRDPADGSESLLFTASLAGAETAFNGAIGIAAAESSGWTPLPPLIHADGVNNELERPHLVVRDGRYHLFFSTQRRTFDPSVSGPTGLYGFVADRLHGPYLPLNGSGLVVRNPAAEPTQAYSWLVLNDLQVVSFVDSYDLQGRAVQDVEAEGADATRRHFGGTIAPTLQLGLDGRRAWLDAVRSG
ncbi:MAG: levansucrase, partial [Gaiellaceae bacterium]|nr:levansucrase [Gaiellaceae bacterium]